MGLASCDGKGRGDSFFRPPPAGPGRPSRSADVPDSTIATGSSGSIEIAVRSSSAASVLAQDQESVREIDMSIEIKPRPQPNGLAKGVEGGGVASEIR